MAEFTRLIMTERGRELLAGIITSTDKIEFTRVSTSERSYGEEEISSLSDLEGIKQTSQISAVNVKPDGKVKIEAAFENRELSEGYYIRAVGLYARANEDGEVLYAVAIEKSGRYSMPAYNNITVNAAYLVLFLAVDSFENIKIEVSPGAFITVSEIGRIKDELRAENEKLNQSLSKAIKDIADSKGASTTTFNADGSVTEENSLETVKTTFNLDGSVTERHEYKDGTVKVLKTVFSGNKVIVTEEKS